MNDSEIIGVNADYITITSQKSEPNNYSCKKKKSPIWIT
jgi:hypothetical protein